jgi:hypothetical protein
MRARTVCWVQRLLERRESGRWLLGGKLAGRARARSWRLSGFSSGTFALLDVMREWATRVEYCEVVVVH